MDLDYAACYADLYRRHWWWRARETFLLEQIAALAPAGGFGPILDVGCGAGLFLSQLSAFGSPEGLEAEESLAESNLSPQYHIHRCRFDSSFEPRKRYGLVLMLDVLEHLDDDVGAMRHAVRLLRDDGILLITVPAFRALWTSHDELNCHRTRYTKSSLESVAAAAGAHLDSTEYFFNALFVAKLLARAKERLVTPTPSPPQVPPEWLNSMLFHFCRLEQRLTVTRHLPAGSSLLAICRASTAEPVSVDSSLSSQTAAAAL